MAINGYSIGGYWCSLLVIILLMDNDRYFINGYWWLLH